MGRESMQPPPNRAMATAARLPAPFSSKDQRNQPDSLRVTATPSEDSAKTGLPLPDLRGSRPADAAVHYALTATDRRGRLADRSSVNSMGWAPKQPVAFTAVNDTIAVRKAADPRTALTEEGFLRLPADLRHRCHIDVGNRLLVAAYRDVGLILICAVAVLDDLIRAHLRELL